jgi:glutamate-ammonia-ligase adenylyltransferase
LLTLLDTESPDFQQETEKRFESAEVADHLLALARRPDSLLGQRTRDRFPELGDQVLEALLGSPDPEQAVRYLRAFLGRFLTPGAYVSALGEDPRALQRLVTVLGASAFVGDALANRPELADIILFGAGAVSNPGAALDHEIESALGGMPDDSDEQERRERFVGALRAVKRRVMVEVAIADLAGALSTREATRVLSELADAELDRAARYELGDQSGLTILAMGKLGGRDIGYGSDLDVVFIYDAAAAPAPDEAPVYFARRAQRIIRAISEPHAAGPGYELDIRLRPSGSQGLLVTSLTSFARYHGVPLDLGEASAHPAVLASGAAWERQALVRARYCAGDPELGRRAIEVAERAAYDGMPPPAEEMHRLRLRMENDLARERPERFDLKTGRGGLLDIEFSTQWLQMKHGADRSVRTPDTPDALEALHRGGYLARADFEPLRDGYRFLRRLEQRIVVQSGVSSSVIDTRRRGMPELARRMGFQDAPLSSAVEQLMARYANVTSEIRAAYGRLLGVLG